MSPTLGAGIGTCYVPAAAARPGTRLEVEIRGRREPAEVVRTPFYRGGSIRR
jgi:aminomethyltransferase